MNTLLYKCVPCNIWNILISKIIFYLKIKSKEASCFSSPSSSKSGNTIRSIRGQSLRDLHTRTPTLILLLSFLLYLTCSPLPAPHATKPLSLGYFPVLNASFSSLSLDYSNVPPPGSLPRTPSQKESLAPFSSESSFCLGFTLVPVIPPRSFGYFHQYIVFLSRKHMFFQGSGHLSHLFLCVRVQHYISRIAAAHEVPTDLKTNYSSSLSCSLVQLQLLTYFLTLREGSVPAP